MLKDRRILYLDLRSFVIECDAAAWLHWRLIHLPGALHASAEDMDMSVTARLTGMQHALDAICSVCSACTAFWLLASSLCFGPWHAGGGYGHINLLRTWPRLA
jgi:hypothetical protein